MPQPATRTLLLDDPCFTYVCHNGRRTVRHLRLWRTVAGGTVAVVTENPDDEGMSVTNAAERVWAAVQRQHGDTSYTLPVIEHYPADGDAQERFDEITMGLGGAPVWKPIAPALMLLSIGVDAYPACAPGKAHTR